MARHHAIARTVAATAITLVVAACRTAEPPEPTYWPGDDLRPEIGVPILAEAGLDDLSLYSDHVVGPVADRPHMSRRGIFAVGNGHAFATMGLADPVNRMHGAVGPDYDKESRFFADLWFTVEVDGEPAEFTEEWIARPRGTALVVTRADAGDTSLYTVDFAPKLDDADPAGIGRIFVVDGPGSVVLRLHSAGSLEERDGHLVEAIDDDGRLLGFLPWQGELVADTEGWLIELDGDQAAMFFATGTDTASLDAIAEDIGSADPSEWMQQTATWWQDWLATGVTIDTSDPRIDDLYEAIRVAVRVQQNHAGGVAPMNRYTRVWTRDTYGPARFYARAGLFDDAWAAVDYLHLCHSVQGDFSNSCSGALDEADKPAEPDWRSMGEFSGRTAAEGPSYVPLAYRDVSRWSGDTTRVEERWDYLHRSVMAQQIEATGTQPFSGDETFRAAMGAASGHPIEYGWDELAWSANSAMLTATSADYLTETALDLGKNADLVELDARGQLARDALDTQFLTDEGWHRPFVFHSDGSSNDVGDQATAPFEDVNLKPLWLGLVERDVDDDLRAVVSHASQGDGTLQSPIVGSIDLQLAGADLTEGIGTGMVPGFYLYDLAHTGDPTGADAFDALHRYAGPSGSYPEYTVRDDLIALQFLYDEVGQLGDTAARYRPWEAAINGDAMLYWLSGHEPTDQGMRVRPHHINELPEIRVSGLRVRDHVVNYVSVMEQGHLSVSFTTTSTEPFRLDVDLPVPEGASAVRNFGPSWGLLEERTGGERWVRFSAAQLAPGDTLVYELTWK